MWSSHVCPSSVPAQLSLSCDVVQSCICPSSVPAQFSLSCNVVQSCIYPSSLSAHLSLSCDVVQLRMPFVFARSIELVMSCGQVMYIPFISARSVQLVMSCVPVMYTLQSCPLSRGKCMSCGPVMRYTLQICPLSSAGYVMWSTHVYPSCLPSQPFHRPVCHVVKSCIPFRCARSIQVKSSQQQKIELN